MITEGDRGSTSTIGRGKRPLFPFPQYIYLARFTNRISSKGSILVDFLSLKYLQKSESDKTMYLKLVFGEGEGSFGNKAPRKVQPYPIVSFPYLSYINIAN